LARVADLWSFGKDMSVAPAMISFMTGWLTAGILSRLFFGSWNKGFRYFYSWIRPAEAPDIDPPPGEEEASTPAQICFTLVVVVVTVLSYTSAAHFLGA
jgi:hypothetical protein